MQLFLNQMQSILTQILFNFFINLITWYDVLGCEHLNIQMMGGNYSNTIIFIVLLGKPMTSHKSLSENEILKLVDL